MYHDYVTITNGNDMSNLEKYGAARDFLICLLHLVKLNGRKTSFLKSEWKADYGEYLSDWKLYDKEKTQVFGIVLGQCSKTVLVVLTEDERFKDFQMGSDVSGLMEILREMMHSNEGSIELNWALGQVLKHILSLHKQKNDSVTRYHRKFASATKIRKKQRGQFYLPSMVKNALEPRAGAGSNRAVADGGEEEENTESRTPDAATARKLEQAREDSMNEAQEAL
jgi:hypothetical protein